MNKNLTSSKAKVVQGAVGTAVSVAIGAPLIYAAFTVDPATHQVLAPLLRVATAVPTAIGVGVSVTRAMDGVLDMLRIGGSEPLIAVKRVEAQPGKRSRLF